MVQLLNTIGECGEVIRDWEVTRQPGGVLVRLRSRSAYDTAGAATAAGEALVDLLVGADFELVGEPVVRARPDETMRAGGWQGWAELVLRRIPRRRSPRV